jgi:hypothetical protein
MSKSNATETALLTYIFEATNPAWPDQAAPSASEETA